MTFPWPWRNFISPDYFLTCGNNASTINPSLTKDIFCRKGLNTGTVEPQCNEGPRDWQNLFAIPGFCYIIEVLFDIFYYYWDKKIVRYTKDFVIWRFIISRFHCNNHVQMILPVPWHFSVSGFHCTIHGRGTLQSANCHSLATKWL